MGRLFGICFLAFLGALYVDQGLESCKVLTEVCFYPRLRVSGLLPCFSYSVIHSIYQHTLTSTFAFTVLKKSVTVGI